MILVYTSCLEAPFRLADSHLPEPTTQSFSAMLHTESADIQIEWTLIVIFHYFDPALGLQVYCRIRHRLLEMVEAILMELMLMGSGDSLEQNE